MAVQATQKSPAKKYGPMRNGIRRYTTASGEVRWEARALLQRDAQGKEVTKTKGGFRTQREAKDWKHSIEEEASRGVKVTDTTTLEEFLTDWLENNVPRDGRAYEDYWGMAKWYIFPHLGRIPLRELDADTIQKFYTYLRKQGSIRENRKGEPMGVWSVIKIHGILSRALKLATKRRIIPYSPMEGVEPPKQPRSRDKGWTLDEARQFLAYVKGTGHRLYPLFAVALQIGTRPGELCGLRWRDVDLKRGIIYINYGLKRGGKNPEFTDLKNENSHRVLPLSDSVVKILKEHRADQNELKLNRGNRYRDMDFVFATRNGTPYLRDNIRRDMNRLSMKAGVPKLSPHGLRHTFKSIADALDVAPRAIQDAMGHASVQTTERYGRRVAPKARQAISAVSSALGLDDQLPSEELDRTGS